VRLASLLSRLHYILQFLFPGGILFICAGVLLYSEVWLFISPKHIDLFGAFVLFFGFLLSWRFDRNRLFYALLFLLMADITERSFIPFPSTVSTHYIVAILVPLNFTLLAIMKEKGIRSIYGLVQLSFLPLQVFLVYWWLTKWDGRYYNLLEVSHFPGQLGSIPDIYAGIVVVALLIQSFRLARYHNPIEIAFVWAILCAVIAGVMTPGAETTLFRITSALIIIISVFEMSYALAYRDELTGLQSRRALHEIFNKLGGQYSIAMADIDHFKKLNDTYGHDVGDQVLKMVAARLIQHSGSGQVYRYGGEEFCLVFKGKAKKEALGYLETLCCAISDEPFIVRHKMRPIKKPENPKQPKKTSKTIKVTISIGVAERQDNLKTPEDVMKAADQALYKAKKAGRNQVKG